MKLLSSESIHYNTIETILTNRGFFVVLPPLEVGSLVVVFCLSLESLALAVIPILVVVTRV